MTTEALEYTTEASSGPLPWRWTADSFHRAAEAGVFPPEARLELMAGQLVTHMPPNPLHAELVDWIAGLLASHCNGVSRRVRQEKPVQLNEQYEPQPDVAVLRGGKLGFKQRAPRADEVLLIIEVADSSLAYDRGEKRRVYAAAGIPEYWIVNLPESVVEVYASPAGGDYAVAHVHTPGEALPLPFQPDVSLSVSTLLGHDPSAANG